MGSAIRERGGGELESHRSVLVVASIPALVVLAFFTFRNPQGPPQRDDRDG
jgi:hypothetical protein